MTVECEPGAVLPYVLFPGDYERTSGTLPTADDQPLVVYPTSEPRRVDGGWEVEAVSAEGVVCTVRVPPHWFQGA